MQRLAKSQSLSYGETEAKLARICSATRRQQNPNRLKKILRHAKARQVSEPVLWRDRSQACQDLLGHEKASRIPILEESKACKGSSKSQSLFYGETEAKHARICSATRRLAESQALKKSPKACKGSSSLNACLWRDQMPSGPESARPREGEQNPKH